MGDEEPKNPLDAFWAALGDKEKLNVRSYGSRNGDRKNKKGNNITDCLLYTSPSPRDLSTSRMPSSA